MFAEPAFWFHVKLLLSVSVTPVDLAWATKLAGIYRADFVCQINVKFLSETCSPTVALFPFVILGGQVRLIFSSATLLS